MSHVRGRAADHGHICVVLAALTLLSAAGCQLLFPPFRRNPDVRLLRSELMSSGSSLSHPFPAELWVLDDVFRKR